MRRLTVVAALVGAVLAVGLLVRVPPSRLPHPVPRPQPAGPTPLPATVPLDRPTGAVLVVATDEGLLQVDVDAASVTALTSRFGRAGNPPHLVLPVTSGVVYQRDAGAYLRTWRGVEVLLAPTAFVLPAGRPDRVWAVRTDRAGTTTVQQVTLDGLPAGPRAALPAGAMAVAGSAHGVVVRDAGGLSLLVAPGDRARLPGGPDVVAAHSDRIATCDQPCRDLRLVDLPAATARDVPAGPLVARAGGVFTPDGATLAVHLLDRGPGPPRPFRVALHTAGGERLQPTLPTFSFPPRLAVEPSGRWLFAVPQGGEPLALDLITGQAYTLPVQLPAVAMLDVAAVPADRYRAPDTAEEPDS